MNTLPAFLNPPHSSCWNAWSCFAIFNSWPETQGRRVDACVIRGKSHQEGAMAEGVNESSVRESVKLGLESMKKYLKKVL